MNLLKLTSIFISAALLAGCASTGPSGTEGPKIVSSGYTTASGDPYAEVGVQFTTGGDFVALFSPTRWKNPVKTGGSLSWLNPVAWSDDAGRTGRILAGEAVVVGGVVVAAVASSSGGGGDDGAATSSGGSSGGSGGGAPPPPSGGGGAPPTSPF